MLKVKFYIKKIIEVIKILLFRSFRYKIRARKCIDSLLEGQVIIDVGASYYPHLKWDIFINNLKTNWIAIDPNSHNLLYCDNWLYKSKITKLPLAVSGEGGTKTLYMTNVDTGSSLLKPVMNSNWEHRVSYSYFFPLKESLIETVSLNSIIEKHVFNKPFALKIDIQGSEFDIIKNLSNHNLKNNLLAVEVENSMQAHPIMLGTTPFDVVYEFFISNKFELAFVKPISSPHRTTNNKIKSKYILNECDFVFLLRFDEIIKRDLTQCFMMLGLYYSYDLFSEILALANVIDKRDLNTKQREYLNTLIKTLR
ncbi:FkbM family methyltransferase [Flavobacteriaceae bacterium LSUCC0859]|nr:FkbM family methyltransferase [Flavobacteriaceae bacterium LSUCC0859]